MALFNHIEARTVKAGNDLRTFQYRFMRASAGNTIDCASAPNLRVTDVVGVLLNKPNSGEHATLAHRGVTKIKAGAAINVNELVTTNASGKATAATSGDLVAGMALTAAGAADEVIDMLLSMPAYVKPNSLRT